MKAVFVLAVGLVGLLVLPADAQKREAERRIPVDLSIAGYFQSPTGQVFRCVEAITDQKGGRCLQGSSIASFGMLFPYPGTNNTFDPSIGGFVGGGENNQAAGYWATAGGGINNTASGDAATVGGGVANTASGFHATVSGGGPNNVASGRDATIGGGYWNTCSGSASTIGGGKFNSAYGYLTTVGGGYNNYASNYGTTVSGGLRNSANGRFATVAGGWRNRADFGPYATVGGGLNNHASGFGASVSGGENNSADNEGATVGGGRYNHAFGLHATVGGGGGGGFGSPSLGNIASGARSTIPGGALNTAVGNYSFAAGREAIAEHDGSFVWGDSQTGTFTKASSLADEFNVYASGGARFFSNSAATTGVLLAPGGGSWTAVSSRDMKENVEPVDTQSVLEAVVTMPITTWNYREQPDSIRHMGPMAQDFYAAFGLGLGETTIDTIDPDGVALAAIQGLSEKLGNAQKEVADLRVENQELRERLERLENLISRSK